MNANCSLFTGSHKLFSDAHCFNKFRLPTIFVFGVQIWDFMTFLSLETLQHCVLVNFPVLGRAILQKSNHPFVIFSKGLFFFLCCTFNHIHELHVKTLPHTYCITDACLKSGIVIYFILSWKFKSMNNCLFNLA